jgi:FtsP/CotA-like multicopper oxidase with cupredoxin domain
VRFVRLITIIVSIALIAAGLIFVSLYAGYFKSPSQSNVRVDHITIVEQDPPGPLAGMNGSYYKSPSIQWPVIRVHQGDTVIITIINNGSYEPHGFAIDHYYGGGVSTAPGQSNVIKFVASEVGTFRMYCDILCSIHPLMQNGAFIVSS